MKGISIGEAELEIMKAVWKAGTPVTSVDIGALVEEKGWKKTTIATFLTRLTEKGALASEKQGKLYYYTSLISEKDYKMSRTKSLIADLFGGSVKDFAVSLFDGETLSEEDMAELRDIISHKGE